MTIHVPRWVIFAAASAAILAVLAAVLVYTGAFQNAATAQSAGDRPAPPAQARSTDAVTTTRQLSADAASRAARAALSQCIRDGHRVSVAVVDRTGLERATLRGDGSGPHTYQSAVRKAYTAASFATPTSVLQQRVQDPAASTLRDIPDVLLLGGGLPVNAGDETIAGIGVAGAPGGDLDEACAQAGVNAVANNPR